MIRCIPEPETSDYLGRGGNHLNEAITFADDRPESPGPSDWWIIRHDDLIGRPRESRQETPLKILSAVNRYRQEKSWQGIAAKARFQCSENGQLRHLAWRRRIVQIVLPSPF